jgi:hypothetical protein
VEKRKRESGAHSNAEERHGGRTDLALSAGPKKRPGSTERFDEPAACRCSLCGQMLSANEVAARRRCLSACAGSVPQPHLTLHPAGAGISERPFARPQQRFRHHCGVKCSRPAPSIPHYKLSRTRSTSGSFAPFGFEADPGRYPRQKPVFRANLPRSCSLCGIHSPSGFSQPSGSKRSTGSTTRSSSRRTSDCLLLPAAILSVSAADQRLKLASSRLTIVP